MPMKRRRDGPNAVQHSRATSGRKRDAGSRRSTKNVLAPLGHAFLLISLLVAPTGFEPVNESGHVFAKLHHDLPWTPDSEV